MSQLGYWKKFGQSDIPVMSYRRRDWVHGKKSLIWHANEKLWDQYFWSFSPKFKKPSNGTLAVFCAVERWGVRSVGLIGMDWVLDENTEWFHDAKAEKAAIENLVEIVDLREHG